MFSKWQRYENIYYPALANGGIQLLIFMVRNPKNRYGILPVYLVTGCEKH